MNEYKVINFWKEQKEIKDKFAFFDKQDKIPMYKEDIIKIILDKYSKNGWKLISILPDVSGTSCKYSGEMSHSFSTDTNFIFIFEKNRNEEMGIKIIDQKNPSTIPKSADHMCAEFELNRAHRALMSGD